MSSSAQEGQRRATDPLELELQAGFRVYKLQGFTAPRLARTLLGRPGRPQPPDFPDSTSWVLGLQVHTTMSSLCGARNWTQCMLSTLPTEPHSQARLVVMQILIRWPNIHGHTCVHLCKHTHTHTRVNNFFLLSCYNNAFEYHILIQSYKIKIVRYWHEGRHSQQEWQDNSGREEASFNRGVRTKGHRHTKEQVWNSTHITHTHRLTESQI